MTQTQTQTLTLTQTQTVTLTQTLTQTLPPTVAWQQTMSHTEAAADSSRLSYHLTRGLSASLKHTLDAHRNHWPNRNGRLG